MRIIMAECKKVFKSPIFIGLILLFSAWNIFVIYESSYFRDELEVVNEIVEQYGVQFNDETLANLNGEIEEELVILNTITEEKIGRSFASVADFFEQLTFEEQELFSDSELQSFVEIAIKEMYLEQAKSIDERYSQFNIQQMGQWEVEEMGLTGVTAEILQKEYAAFSERFSELQDNGEHLHWFFAGKPYRMHSLLFRTMFTYIILEALILIVLATAFITNYEFDHRTQLVTYTTKRGRTVMRDKLMASLLVATGITTFLLAVTLGAYFTIFDYSYMWNTSINSGFNWEFNFPYVSWWDWSVGTYLMMGIVLLFTCMLLFSLFTFAITVILKNIYYTFITFAILFIAGLIIPWYVPATSFFILIAGFNLSTLVINPHQWWMATSGLLMFRNYEWMTILAWSLILISLCFIAMKRFRKEDLS